MVSPFHCKISSIAAHVIDTIRNKKRKNAKVECIEEAEEAFRKLKHLLISTHVLVNPGFSQSFEIQAESNDVGIVAVLSKGEGKNETVIAYASIVLNNP